MVTYDENERFEYQRQRMVDNQLGRRGIKDQRVLDAMGQIPREAFMAEKYQDRAYDDSPCPIGMGQTISQPYIVALMTEKLNISDDCEVLELGTGCGYQTAVLAKLARRVYTIERHNQLAEAAQANLAGLGIDNVEFCIGDGTKGWPRDRQFDRIIITAAAAKLPGSIIDQLAEDGIIVAPIGQRTSQNLIQFHKRGDELVEKYICGCRFVSLIGDEGFTEQ
jgi:protein-L-isoaspartate(D-aspartate) O-methyltransferase